MQDLIFKIALKLNAIVGTLSDEEYKKQISKFEEVERLLEELSDLIEEEK